MTGRLLNRQARLLEYLTSGKAIFGGRRAGALDPALQGIDPRLLDLEARFSHEKRMEKIAGVFPATFVLLGADLERVVHEFADRHPPRHIGRVDNARQFFEFLAARSKRKPLPLAHLLDVAACELACAEARLRAGADVQPETETANTTRPAIRRRPGVVLLRAAFDIRKVFASGDGSAPRARDTPLAIAWISDESQILELPAEVFDLLTALDDWIALDLLPGADELISDLTQSGILERRG